ncbi:MAG: DapH/DapD/GlmU-related protein [Thermodesulfobacteriota bacterium]
MKKVRAAEVLRTLAAAGLDCRLSAREDTLLPGPVNWASFDGAGLAFYDYDDPAPLRRWDDPARGLVLCRRELENDLPGGPFLFTDNVRYAFVLAAGLFIEPPLPGVHPSAVIDPEAEIGRGVAIGPLSVIGAARIGDGCRLGAHVTVADQVTLGREVTVMNGANLGEPGLGSVMDNEGRQVLFPHFAGLEVGDHVVVGPGAVLNRGVLRPTVIGEGTHISASCTVAHNVVLGRQVYLCPGVHLGGSVRVGDRCFLGLGACVRDGLELAERVTVGMNAAVVKSCLEPGTTLVGAPARALGNMFGQARE